MKTKLVSLLLCLLSSYLNAQDFLDVAGGNALITNTGTAKLEVLSKTVSSTGGIGLGDDNTLKSIIAYDGLNGLLRINNAPDFTPKHLTIDDAGMVGLNAFPANARLFINHNSTSGLSGSAHIELQETGTSDFSRLKFTNTGNTAQWTLAARSEVGNSLFNFFYNNGTDFANILSLDGDNFRVGIRQTSPEAYLHIKQVDADIDALILENDDQTGSEKWGLRIGNDDLEFRYEGELRAYISAATGAYTAVPPVAEFSGARVSSSKEQEQVMEMLYQINLNEPESLKKMEQAWPSLFYTLDGYSEKQLDYSQLNVLSLMALKNQKELFERQTQQLAEIDQETSELLKRLENLERNLKK